MENTIKINQIVSQQTLEKLKNKGLDEVFVQEKINSFSELAKKIGADPVKYVKLKLEVYFHRFLQSDMEVIKGTVLGVRRVRDLYQFHRDYSSRNEGMDRSGYKVSPGKFSWNGLSWKQGDSIPEGKELWELQGELLIEYKDKIYIKPFTMLNSDKTKIPELKTFDLVSFKFNASRLNNNGLILNGLNVLGTLTDDQVKALLPTLESKYYKTSTELYDTNYNGFCVMKGGVSIIENNRFDIIDTENLDVTKLVSGYMRDINFVEGAENLVFLGNAFKTNDGGYMMTVYHCIVPDEFKPVKVGAESEVLEKQADDIFESDTSADEDLL